MIDGGIAGAKLMESYPERVAKIGVDALVGLSDAFLYLHGQPRNAWTHELDLRTHKENLPVPLMAIKGSVVSDSEAHTLGFPPPAPAAPPEPRQLTLHQRNHTVPPSNSRRAAPAFQGTDR